LPGVKCEGLDTTLFWDITLPKVSILLPVFNGERYLGPAIEAVLAQTYGDFELIICDDVSTDGSAKIISDYAARDRRILAYTNHTNLGLFGNYNECLKKAQGQYIKPFAQDDLFEPVMLEKMVPLLDRDNEVALASCARRSIDSAGREIKVLSRSNNESKESAEFARDQVLLNNMLHLTNDIGEPSSVIFRRQWAGNGFDTEYYHLGDIEYWFRILEHGKYLYFNEALCSFRHHKDSTTTKNAQSLRFALDMLRLGKQYQDFLQEKGVTQAAYKRLVIETTASHMKYLMRRKQFCPEDFLTIEAGSPESMAAELLSFKEMLFYALLTAAEKVDENCSLKLEWEAERNRLEDTISRLLKSRSWKLTRPLRGAIKALRSYSHLQAEAPSKPALKS
jgi:glycosyltransferase involved in cell wall biosynthesis